MKRIVLIVLSIAGLVVGGALIGRRLFAPRSEDVRFIEVTLDEVRSVSANHRQGSIGFTINSEEYFYYVGGSDDSERTIAVSALLADLQRASTVQIRSERYGLHRLVTNLLLFYGQRTIPASLKPKAVQGPSTEVLHR